MLKKKAYNTEKELEVNKLHLALDMVLRFQSLRKKYID